MPTFNLLIVDIDQWGITVRRRFHWSLSNPLVPSCSGTHCFLRTEISQVLYSPALSLLPMNHQLSLSVCEISRTSFTVPEMRSSHPVHANQTAFCRKQAESWHPDRESPLHSLQLFHMVRHRRLSCGRDAISAVEPWIPGRGSAGKAAAWSSEFPIPCVAILWSLKLAGQMSGLISSLTWVFCSLW